MRDQLAISEIVAIPCSGCECNVSSLIDVHHPFHRERLLRDIGEYERGKVEIFGKAA